MQDYLQIKYLLDDPNVISVIDDLPLWSAPFGLKLLDMVILKKHIQVLDIGSGTGFPIIELSQRLGNTCKVYGIDPWKEAVDRIRFKIKIWKICNVEMIEGKAEQMPFANNFFDLIVSNNGINNVDDEVRVYQEVARISKTGCQLVITVNLQDTMKEFYTIYERILKDIGRPEEIEKLHEHIFSKRKPLGHTKKLIHSAGFDILDIYEDKFKLNFTDGTTMFNHFLIQIGFLESWKAIIKEEDWEKIFKKLEEELNIFSQRKKELSLTIPWVSIDCRKKT